MTVYDELLREATDMLKYKEIQREDWAKKERWLKENIDSALFALESAVKSVRQLKEILEDTV